MRARLQRALTPKSVEVEQEVIREIFAPLSDGGPFDFAQGMLMLPVAVAGVAMDLPREDWPRLCHLLNASVSAHDDDYCHIAGLLGVVRPLVQVRHAYAEWCAGRSRSGD